MGRTDNLPDRLLAMVIKHSFHCSTELATAFCRRLSGLLLVVSAFLLGAGPSHAINLREAPLLAEQIGYRLDRELGSARAARHHLLAWRLHSALVGREFAAGDLIQEQALRWENNMGLLETGRSRSLPAWFSPIEMGTLEPLLLGHLPQVDSATWHANQKRAAADALVRRVSADLAPEWVAQQYPPLLAWARDHAPMIWQSLLTSLAENPDWVPLVAPIFADKLALPLDAPLAQWLELTDQAGLELKALETLPADAALSLLARQAQLLQSEELLVERAGAPDLLLAPYLLYRGNDQPMALNFAMVSLARALADVERGGFAELVEVFTGVVGMGLIEPSTLVDQPLTDSLEILRSIDPLLLAQMSQVDPALSDTYLRLRQLLGDALQREPADRGRFLGELASLRAAADRHTSDLEGYLQQPVRGRVSEDLDICLDLSRFRGQYPMEPITIEQYSSCLSGFVSWGLEFSRSAELSGRSSGPFEVGNLSRELALNPWQRINYWVGYVDSRYQANCGPFDETLVNPLEWSLAANAYAWFSERWPAYVNSQEQQAEIARLMSRGESVLENLRRMDQCRRFSDSPGRSALRVVMESYAQALDLAVAEMGAQSEQFRDQRLEPGADLRLDGNAEQTTNYRPESLRVLPCNGVAQCGMDQELLPSRALLGLLPQTFLLADQARVGQLSACYGNVQWIERRGEPTRVGNAAMARYSGRLSFDLTISFSTLREPVRQMRLTSQDEYEYLFGANSPEVLNNPCPIDLVGTQVVSQLPSKGVRLVPSRLTFMTAGRADPSQIFASQWAQGNEWRDRFVTGEGVELLSEQSAEPLIEPVNNRLNALYQQWNDVVYVSLLDADSGTELGKSMSDVEREKRLLISLTRLLEPFQTIREPANRAALFGPSGLFDRARANELSRQSVPVNQIPTLALGLLEDARFLFGGASTSARSRQAEPLITNTLARLESLRYRLSASGQN